MLHGSETWPVRKENEVALQRAEVRMVRWMCGVKLQDRFPSRVERETRIGCYSNTTVYYEIHESSECISVDCGVTNLIHDCRSCVDFMLEVRQMWLDVSTQA